MQKKTIYKNVDSLIQGIETILSENRCSFSDDERVLLTKSISYLKESKREGSKKPFDWNLIMKVFEILLKVFGNSDDLTNLF